jgi:hypothetical protein
MATDCEVTIAGGELTWLAAAVYIDCPLLKITVAVKEFL